MKTNTERIGTLEMRVDRLETWAGPGQADALAGGLRGVCGVRTELGVVRRVQDQHTGMLNGLKSDVAGLTARLDGLETDMAEMKATLREVLRRLPPAAGGQAAG